MIEESVPVSVVIPMFNSAATIERALASVATQSQLPREVIVVDDASTDTSAMVVEQWSDNRIKTTLIRHSTNLGPSASRNNGWDSATQEFIAFLDADDAWHPEKLRIQSQLMQRDSSIALSGHQYDIGDDARWSDFSTNDYTTSTFKLSDFLIKNRLSTPTVMLRRELQFRFASDQRFSEDYRLWMEIVSEYGPASFINLSLTRLFKPAYGESGLSGHMRSMYRGELNTFSAIRKKHLINRPIMIATMLWSTLKYIRRRARLVIARK